MNVDKSIFLHKKWRSWKQRYHFQIFQYIRFFFRGNLSLDLMILITLTFNESSFTSSWSYHSGHISSLLTCPTYFVSYLLPDCLESLLQNKNASCASIEGTVFYSWNLTVWLFMSPSFFAQSQIHTVMNFRVSEYIS